MITQLLLISISLNVISGYILLDEQQHRTRTLKTRTFFICLCIEAILLGVASIFNYPIFKTISMLFCNVLIGYGLFHHKRTALLYDGFFALTMGAGELLILPLIQVINQSFDVGQSNAILFIGCAMLLVQLFIFYVYHIYRKLKYDYGREENTGFAWLNFIVLPIFSFLNIIVIATISQFYLYSWILYASILDIFFVLYLNIYLSYVYQSMMKSLTLKRELALYQQKSELQYDYYQKLEENYQKSRQLIHDVKRHLQMVNTTGDSTYKENFQTYLNQYAMPIYSNHKLLNMILYEKAQEAHHEQIEFTCAMTLLDLKFMKDIDMTTIFLNLLDNAMDACRDCEKDRWISLKADTIRDFLVIEIANSLQSLPEKKLTSSKKFHEGLGLRNVEQALENYGGNMQVEYDAQSFRVHVYLPMK